MRGRMRSWSAKPASGPGTETPLLEQPLGQFGLAFQVLARNGANRRLEFELGAGFEGACGFELVLAVSQRREHGPGPFGRADLHPRRNPLDRQGRFAPQPSKFPLLTLLDAPDFTRLATGNPKAGRPCHPGRRKAWRRQAPPCPESVIHRELAFQAQIPRQSRQRVLANQLRRGVLNSHVESAELEPVLCRQVRKHGNSSKASRIACSLTG
jgi:hypothetical protein